MSQKLLSAQLLRLGCEVSCANDGQDALERVAQQDFDIIFMDCQMPVMDGFTATAEIRRQQGERIIPIIAVTANVMTRERERCYASGMDEVLAKPLKQDAIARLLFKHGLIGPGDVAPEASKPLGQH